MHEQTTRPGPESEHSAYAQKVLPGEMSQVMPWTELVALMVAHAPVARTGRPPFDLEMMRRIHCLQQRFELSELDAEEALFEMVIYRDFAGLSGTDRIPDRISILRFRPLLEAHALSARILHIINDKLSAQGLMLKSGSVVDATLIAAPSSTKNKDGKRDPEMHQTKKGNQWHFGMKAQSAWTLSLARCTPSLAPPPMLGAGMSASAFVPSAVSRMKSARIQPLKDAIRVGVSSGETY